MKIKNMNRAVLVFLAVMAVLSVSNFFGLQADGEPLRPAGLAVIVGIAAYFITAKTNEHKNEGLDIVRLPELFKNKRALIYAAMPLVMNIICLFAEKAFMPEVTEQTKARIFLDTSQLSPAVFFQLVILALGEEIAMRAFFQKQTSKFMGFAPSLIVTSVFFAVAHFSGGEPVTAAVDLFFVFVNSVFYGLTFKETDNAWCSW
ncbi:MAG: CPBP family intramembrane metalloprotease [Oscillospiraceae bacterium]|nr:CPBP family intramembrane metalloprotease [Oscillospiraceae bacterium]